MSLGRERATERPAPQRAHEHRFSGARVETRERFARSRCGVGGRLGSDLEVERRGRIDEEKLLVVGEIGHSLERRGESTREARGHGEAKDVGDGSLPLRDGEPLDAGVDG
jgi:hypothetical protein